MIKYFLTIFLLFALDTPIIAHSRPSQLVPCSELFNRSRPLELHYNVFLKQLNATVNLHDNKLLFAILYFPDRQPESAIIVYKSPSGEHFVNCLRSPIDMFYSISVQSEGKYKNLFDVPLNTVFDLPSFQSRGNRKISPITAEAIRQSMIFTMNNRIFNKDELRNASQTMHYGIPVRYFVDENNNCGFMPPILFTGTAEHLARFTDTLEGYINGKVSEKNVLEAAQRIK